MFPSTPQIQSACKLHKNLLDQTEKPISSSILFSNLFKQSSQLDTYGKDTATLYVFYNACKHVHDSDELVWNVIDIRKGYFPTELMPPWIKESSAGPGLWGSNMEFEVTALPAKKSKWFATLKGLWAFKSLPTRWHAEMSHQILKIRSVQCGPLYDVYLFITP